jgi:hypothetical protein
MSDATKQIGHMVFFKLNDNSGPAKQAMLEACQKYLTGHPGTDYFSVGTVADHDRDVNDRDFDIALHLVFENVAAHDQYQVAPRHDQFIAENKDNWAHVRVFDSVI